MPSTRTPPRPYLLTAAGRYDAGAVMRLAHDLARDDIADAARCGRIRPYKIAFRDALRSAWITAQTQQWCFKRDAAQAAAVASNDRMALSIIELRHDRQCASMIDSLTGHLAAVADVAARSAALGVRL